MFFCRNVVEVAGPVARGSESRRAATERLRNRQGLRTLAQEVAPGASAHAAIMGQPGRHAPGSVRLSKWYICQIEPGLDALVIRLLRWTGFVFRQFLYEHQRPRKKPLEKSWFPNYLFIELDLMRDPWEPLLDMPGVIRLLGVNPMLPIPLKPGAIEAMADRLPYKAREVAALQAHAPGDVVRVVNGSWASFTAPCISCDHTHIKVSLGVFGRTVDTTLLLSDVEGV